MSGERVRERRKYVLENEKKVEKYELLQSLGIGSLALMRKRKRRREKEKLKLRKDQFSNNI